MHVLHCIASIDASSGGPTTSARSLCKGLANRGVKSTILSCSTGDIARDQKNASAFAGANFIWSQPLIKRFYWNPLLSKKIVESICEFDLLHVYGVFNGLAAHACRAARESNTAYILEPFGTLSPYCLSKSSLKKKISLAIEERKNIEQASAIRFTSKAEWKRAAENFQVRRGFVAPIGIDWSEFKTLPARGAFRKKFQLEEDEKVLLFLGRLQPIKALEVFLPAFAKWNKSSPEAKRWRCVIIGPGESGYRGELESISEKLGCGASIIFTGPLYGADRVAALADSDVVFLPSFHENFGVSVVEAMACGKPVLISDQVDVWPFVKEFDLGEVATISQDGFMVALKNISAREGEWATMGARARRWVEMHCDWDEISEIVLNVYQQTLNLGRRDWGRRI